MDQQQRQADQDFQLAVAQQQEQQRQQQQYIDAAMQASANEMQLDADSLGSQAGFDPSFETQANLHRHYAAMAAQDTLPFDAASPAALSFAPPPDLVQTALQQAAMNPNCESLRRFRSLAFVRYLTLPHLQSSRNTPADYSRILTARLAPRAGTSARSTVASPRSSSPSNSNSSSSPTRSIHRSCSASLPFTPWTSL
jgi:hypothetical protein